MLIVDDETRIVSMLQKFIEGKGLLVDCAPDGEKALSLMEKQNYNMVFLDVNMPGRNGIEVSRYIKDKHIPTKVIILTGYPCLNENFCKIFGADEYLEKPVDLKIIGEIINKYTSS